ncbi:hypothetical protein AKJ49_00880 [candidate division MSBL1 archaeon SCGC-AAA382A03]|uniref:Uncharacterized protein n=1 Tax=candidate division MSBL1 archaeon SCGC-AAA382A03 TaxID=1698278 RepID=A0A133VG51_9EURY|nr:hypothetical protein AKJ49_00880 [candidate division MSBL1 archaeon SCGC-AAA382A03]
MIFLRKIMLSSIIGVWWLFWVITSGLIFIEGYYLWGTIGTVMFLSLLIFTVKDILKSGKSKRDK